MRTRVALLACHCRLTPHSVQLLCALHDISFSFAQTRDPRAATPRCGSAPTVYNAGVRQRRLQRHHLRRHRPLAPLPLNTALIQGLRIVITAAAITSPGASGSSSGGAAAAAFDAQVAGLVALVEEEEAFKGGAAPAE